MDHSNLDQKQVRLNKIEQLKALGVEVYPSNFAVNYKAVNIHQDFAHLENGEKTDVQVMVAGRIMSMRNSGMFIDLHDDSGKIQIFSDSKILDPLSVKILPLLDLGDFIGIAGNVRRTPRGEITVDAKEITFLTKSLTPLPEKYHGVVDTETRYRQRYVDCIANPESKNKLINRFKIIGYMRQLLANKGFLEVETPMLHTIAGGALAKPFVTHHNALGMDLFLRIAPELYLKRLIIGGVSDKIFEINRCFRNEGISTRHNPEFTTIELYQAYVGYQEMMSITEWLFREINLIVNGQDQVNFGDKVINFAGPWASKSMIDLVHEHTGVNFAVIADAPTAVAEALKLGVKVKPSESWGKTLEAVFAEKVEEKLIQPIHVTHFPTEISPLSKVCTDDSRLTERFETYINGWEVANGFSELNDPIDQYNRFMGQLEERAAGNDEAHALDQDFITALEYGMPPTGGLGIGIDRMAMLLTNSLSIREIIAFPTLRHKS